MRMLAIKARFGKLGGAVVATLLVSCAVSLPLAIPSDLPIASAAPLPTDSQGFVNSPARCAPDQSAVAAGRTSLSLVTICADGRGGYEYRGMRLSDRAVLTLPARPLTNGCFGARTDAVNYTVSERKLLLTAGLRVLRDETMLEFRDYRIPTDGKGDAAATITKQAPTNSSADPRRGAALTIRLGATMGGVKQVNQRTAS